MFVSVIVLVVVGGCQKDEVADPVPVATRTTTYNLVVKDILGISGKVKFTETSSTVATIDIVLTGAAAGVHPAELCMNSSVEGGTVVIALNPVDAGGNSTTVTTVKTFDQLIVFDGFIQILKSTSEPNIILAQADIGGNLITATNKSYSLDTIGVFGVSGTALFEKRLNGNTLMTITLIGAIAGEIYPATINLGSIETVGGGPVIKSLSNVDGTNGKSFNNIRKLDSGLDITYDNWMVYDGYINIYQGTIGLDHIICHGNIGSN
ncbi:MAG: hypothetical protein K9I69_09225 [Ignavibacteriales bacterium]|nr:hypothetical protein [Ignavibacteriales bacterium]